MKGRIFIWTVSLLTVLLASACAPAVIPQPAAPTLPPLPMPIHTPETATQFEVPTEAATQIPVPIATSRGPDLEATDPIMVTLESGGLQLVEFFRFT